MNQFRTVLATLLALGILAAAARAQLKEAPSDKPAVAVKSIIRKEGEKPNTNRVIVSWQGERIAADHEVHLQYQFRIHTEAGKYGEVLATKEFPAGIAYGALSLKADKDGRVEAEKECIVDPSTFEKNINLPKNAFDLVIRFEPQVFDKTASRHLTDPKSPASFLVIDTDEKGRVQKVQSITEWFRDQFANAKSASRAVQTMDSLDCEDPGQHKLIVQAWEGMLNGKDVEEGSFEILIRALPAIDVVTHLDCKFEARLKELAERDGGNIRDAAKAKLAEIARTVK